MNSTATFLSNPISQTGPGPDGVDLYLAVPSADASFGSMEEFVADTVSPEEFTRAARYRSEQKRRQFLFSRYCLRHVLSGYLPRAPKDIVLTTDQTGRPVISEPPEIAGVPFSLSHSGAVTAIVVGREGLTLGVDIEPEVGARMLTALSRIALTPGERNWVARNDTFTPCAAMTLLWTIKEAAVKAAGCGLSDSFDSVEVDTNAAPLRVVHRFAGTKRDFMDVCRFRLTDDRIDTSLPQWSREGNPSTIWGAIVTAPPNKVSKDLRQHNPQFRDDDSIRRQEFIPADREQSLRLAGIELLLAAPETF